MGDRRGQVRRGHVVSILTRPEGRVPSFATRTTWTAAPEFQSSPAPKGGCHQDGAWVPFVKHGVSILTRPEGRVPSIRPAPRQTGPEQVSILTRPEGRVPFPPGRPPLHDHRVSILTRPEGRVP